MNTKVLNIITNEFSKRKAGNPSYSLRAYSNSLGIQASALSEILNGKRKLSKKMAAKALSGLNYSNLEVEKLVFNSKSTNASEELSLEHFKVIADWYYFAILSLAELDNFKAKPEWIAERLNITKTQAKIAMNKLLKLGMLEADEFNQIKPTYIQYKTPTDIANAALKKHTIESLELSKQSLIHDPLELRDFSTVTVAIDPEKIKSAKHLIQNFQKKIIKHFEGGKKSEVYKLSIQLFPLTRRKK